MCIQEGNLQILGGRAPSHLYDDVVLSSQLVVPIHNLRAEYKFLLSGIHDDILYCQTF